MGDWDRGRGERKTILKTSDSNGQLTDQWSLMEED